MMHEKRSKKPNLLLLMVDQWRWDGLGVTGGWADTPNLDALAKEGTLFENCLTNSPICIPARISLATGLYPHNTGVWSNVQYDLSREADTWMKRVQQAGYRTSIIGKSHIHQHAGDLRDWLDHMHDYGYEDVDEIAGPRRCRSVLSNMTETWERLGLWDAYKADYTERFSNKSYVTRPSALPLEHYADVYVGQQAKMYLRKYNDERPWCCTVSFGGPHEPWDAPEPYASMYKPDDMPKPITRLRQPGENPAGFLDQLYEVGNGHSPAITALEVAQLRANYAGNIKLIDDQIGEILQVLREKDELDNTMIVFVSDHGEMNGDHGLIYKENFLNSAVKVPLIIWTKELKKSNHRGTRYADMVEWFDIGPTFVEAAGGDMSPRDYDLHAKSLMATLSDPASIHREEAICEVHGEIMIQNKRWKMALNKEGVPYLLFDLEHDPNEQHNLIHRPDHAHVIGQLQSKLRQRLISSQTKVAAGAAEMEAELRNICSPELENERAHQFEEMQMASLEPLL